MYLLDTPETLTAHHHPGRPRRDYSAGAGLPVAERRRTPCFSRKMLFTRNLASWLVPGFLAAPARGGGGYEHKPVAPPWPLLTLEIKTLVLRL